MGTKKKKKIFLSVFMIIVVLLWLLSHINNEKKEKIPKLLSASFYFHGKENLSGSFLTSKKEVYKNRKEYENVTAEAAAQGIDDKKIRVLLKNQNFTSFYHTSIQITSSKEFYVYQTGKRKRYAAGKRVSFSADALLRTDKPVDVFPVKNGRLKILSFTRMNHCPSYRGKLRIRKKNQGLLLVNELTYREYLYSVVSSEISSSGPLEALKAQAVCARTYAANRKRASEYEKYGADIDDSDACQVYNNIPEDEKSRRAVKETRDMVLVKDGKRIPVYYFSTSWGYTASGREVWNTEEEIPYLRRKFQITEQSERKTGKKISPDLSGEKAFRLFLDRNSYRDKSSGKICSFETYDSSSPWFRWQIRVPWEHLERQIEEKIKACYEAYPNLVFFQKSTGGFSHGKYRKLGTLKQISPGKRDMSGLVTELILEGSKSTVMIRTQYSVRKLLCIPDEEIVLMDGSTHASPGLLPSAAFYLKKMVHGGRVYLVIKGGGFGHGTGMSQWGARVQAGLGWSFQRILKFYFEGITIGYEKEEKEDT